MIESIPPKRRAEQRKYRLTTAWFYSRFKKIMFSVSARFFSTAYFVPKYFKKIASSEERRVATWENYYRFMISVSVSNDNCIMFNDIPVSASGDHIQYDVWPTYHNLISIIPWIIYIYMNNRKLRKQKTKITSQWQKTKITSQKTENRKLRSHHSGHCCVVSLC